MIFSRYIKTILLLNIVTLILIASFNLIVDPSNLYTSYFYKKNDLITQDFAKKLDKSNHLEIGQLISSAENYGKKHASILSEIEEMSKQANVPILGITGTGGAGKSSLVDELVRRFLIDFPEKDLAIVSVDPSKRKTG